MAIKTRYKRKKENSNITSACKKRNSGGDRTKLKVKNIRLADIPLCPEFHPTEEEFLHPIAYIKNIYKNSWKHGIVKIVPPKSWKESDPSRFFRCRKKFNTKKQYIHKLKEARGHDDGGTYTANEFKTMADSFLDNVISSKSKLKKALLKGQDKFIEELEKHYWNVVDKSLPLTVEYGSDLSSSSFESGFEKNKKTFEPGEKSWNLNVLPETEGSLLNQLGEKISGVNVPWVYFGMVFSTFCWHYEDDALCSVSFNHTGAPKLWYGVGGHQAELLENTVQKLLPHLFRSEPDLMLKLVTMLNPKALRANSVDVVKAVHRPGEFMVTFPHAFHSGFNTGFNIAEAVNFAPAFWLSEGLKCSKKYSMLSREPILCPERIAISFVNEIIAGKDNKDESKEDLKSALEAIRTMIESEKNKLKNIKKMAAEWGIEPEVVNVEKATNDDLITTCNVCMSKCFVSYFECQLHNDVKGCLKHVSKFCSCGRYPKRRRERRRLCVAISVESLMEIMRELESKFR